VTYHRGKLSSVKNSIRALRGFAYLAVAGGEGEGPAQKRLIWEGGGGLTYKKKVHLLK